MTEKQYFIVTTSFNPSVQQQDEAKRLARDLSWEYRERRKDSLKKIIGERQGALVVYKTELIFLAQDGSRLSFHPDTAMLRIKNEHDPLRLLLGKEPRTILDTTMGMANDSMVMAYQGHRVTALESSPIIHLIVSRGLASYQSDLAVLNSAMRSIKTHLTDSLSYLQHQKDKAFDIIYFDPMFSRQLSASPDFSGLRALADPRPLCQELLEEAKRVAREAVILKAYYRDPIFEKMGFERHKPSKTKFHYGILRLNEVGLP